LNFQGTTHLWGVGSFNILLNEKNKRSLMFGLKGCTINIKKQLTKSILFDTIYVMFGDSQPINERR
jgi:hypothetical protein